MNKRVFLGIASMLIISAVMVNGCLQKSKGRIKIKGSTTLLPIMQHAGNSFNKRSPAKISIEGSCSSDGIEALLNGSCDIAASSRRMNLDEQEIAKQKELAIKEIVIAKDMITVIVNSENPVSGISMKQLKDIYSGEHLNWQDVGGDDASILIVSREDCSGTLDVWNEMVLKEQATDGEAMFEPSNSEVLRIVSENKYAIGYIAYGYLNRHVKALSLNSIEAKPENFGSGKYKYPLSRELFIYIDENTISEKTMEFIVFLTGPDGEKSIQKAGFILNKSLN